MRRIFGILLALGLFACQATPTSPVELAPLPTAPPLPDISSAKSIPLATPVIPPAVSPLGVRVVYVKGGNLWLWAGNSVFQLTDSGQDGSPRLSGDGQLVLFLRASHLWAVNVDGSNPRQLDALDASTGVTNFYILPGTHSIYITTQQQTGSLPEPNYDLYVVEEADLPPVRRLFQPGDGGLVTFSPDGKLMALAQPEKINIASVDGSNLKTVFTFPRVVTYSDWAFIPPVAWLSNSYGFKTVIPPADGPNPARFMFIAAEGGAPAQLALIQAAPVALGYFPYISASSDTVAYLREQGGNLELHTIDASTADKTLLAYPKDKFGLLGWAGDGVSLVYWVDDLGKTQLRRPDGSIVPLGGVVAAAQVTWIDATQYLFLNGNELRLGVLGEGSMVLDAGDIKEFSGIFIQ